VTDEQLLGLLTPELVAQLVVAAFDGLGIKAVARVYGEGQVYASAYGVSITVERGRVRATSSFYPDRAERVAEAVSSALALAVDALFSRKIAEALVATTGKRPQIREVEVEEDGVVKQAVLFGVRY
jgi:hypothetical protein